MSHPVSTESREQLLIKLNRAYKQMVVTQERTEYALNAYIGIEVLEKLVNKLKKTDYLYKELLIAQNYKSVPVNIGAEDSLLTDTLDKNDSSEGQVRRATAKSLARRLYALHHPDRGGSQETFNVIRRAAKAGDLETLYYFRVRDGVDTFTEDAIKGLLGQIEARQQLFCGKPSFQITMSFFSNKEDYVVRYKAQLESRIQTMQAAMFGLEAKRQ